MKPTVFVNVRNDMTIAHEHFRAFFDTLVDVRLHALVLFLRHHRGSRLARRRSSRSKDRRWTAREEIFGPVLCVIAYDTEEGAIRIANDTKYGLHAFVSGTDIQRARRVASQILAGRVAINGMLDDPDAPWGRFKYSGIGREFGKYGIEAFLEPRAILE